MAQGFRDTVTIIVKNNKGEKSYLSNYRGITKLSRGKLFAPE